MDAPTQRDVTGERPPIPVKTVEEIRKGIPPEHAHMYRILPDPYHGAVVELLPEALPVDNYGELSPEELEWRLTKGSPQESIKAAKEITRRRFATSGRIIDQSASV